MHSPFVEPRLACGGCPRPVSPATGYCDACRPTVIAAARDVVEPLRRVHHALAGWAVIPPRRIRFELRSHTAMTRALGSPAIVGATRYLCRIDGTVVGPAVVTVRAGLPSHVFEAVAAHELTHVALIAPTRLPGLLDEGLAEYVAFRYLTEVLGSESARAHAASMTRRRGDAYGDGLELVRRLVRSSGFDAVWRAAVARSSVGRG